MMNASASRINVFNFLSQNMWLTNYSKKQPPYKRERAQTFIKTYAKAFDVM
jgi:hypothetical protein